MDDSIKPVTLILIIMNVIIIKTKARRLIEFFNIRFKNIKYLINII